MPIIALLFLPILLMAHQITVSIAPQAWIVHQIAPDMKVQVMIPKAASPVTYTPKPNDLLRLKKSALYLTIGVPFEQANIERFKSANPNMRLQDMSRYVAKLPITTHVHDHHHEALDPHTWLAPPQLMLLARATLEDLIQLDPAQKTQYLQNYRKLIETLARFDSTIYAELADYKRPFLVYHPSFGYFAKVYGLTQIAIEDEGKEPSAAHLAQLLTKAKAAKILIIEPQFPKRSAQLLARKLDLSIVTIDPLAPNPLQTIQKVADALRR